jgi:hypothetical protein
MKARAMRWLAAVAAAVAMDFAMAEVGPAACDPPASDAHPLMDRGGTLSRYEQLPAHCLKAMFMRCAAEASEQMLDFGSAAVCSIGYEALLRRGFSGNFQALMAWWRAERDAGAASN